MGDAKEELYKKRDAAVKFWRTVADIVNGK